MSKDEICRKYLRVYWVRSIIFSIIIFIIYLFFTTKLETFQFNEYSLIVSASMSILVGYEYALKNYSLSNICQIFTKFNPLSQTNQYISILSSDLKKNLHKSQLYYLIIILVVLPFLILDIKKVLIFMIFNDQKPYYFCLQEPENKFWGFLLDVTNFIVQYWTLYLLAQIIWIMIELTILINKLERRYLIRINVFDIDETGGLKPLRSFVLSIVSSYFLIITLAIISYAPPNATILIWVLPEAIINLQIILIIIMLLIGVILFVVTQKTIRDLIDKGIKSEVNKINKKYKETYDRVLEINSKKQNNEKEKELKESKIFLEILEIEERKIKEINLKKFDSKTIITFISTILPPIVAIIKGIIIH